MTAHDVQALEARHVLQTYARQPVVFTRGDGTRLYDIEGREYLDFLSGIGVTVLGHAHPGLARVIADQAATLLHTSNLYFHPLQGHLAAQLASLSGLARAFFCNSGTEAMEACLKFARRYWYSQGVRGRTRFVAFENGFSGRTMGALSVTANPHYREPFEPLIPGVTFLPVGDTAALEGAVTHETAAIVIEPIQGEGGVRPIPQEFAAAIERVCAATGTLLIADEVQCGLGRTGQPFHFQTLGLTPDLVPIGKALGSGFPIGAALVSDTVAAQIAAGDHGTTYGGNLLATRAALYVLEQLTTGGVMAHVRAVGEIFAERLARLQTRHAVVTGVRGAGVMRGLVLSVDAGPLVEAARQKGLLVNRTAGTVVRMLPPFTVTADEIDRACAILDEVLATLPAGGPA